MAKGGCCGAGSASAGGRAGTNASRGAAYISFGGNGGLLIGGGTYGITPSSMFVPSFDLIAQEQSANSGYGSGYKNRQSYSPHVGNRFSQIYQPQTPQGYHTLDDKVNYAAASANTANYDTKTIAEKASDRYTATKNTNYLQ